MKSVEHAMVATCLVVAVCLPGLAAAQAPAKASNFWGAIQANPQLTTMANFVKGTGDIAAALQNPALAALTVFAPTNAAFNQMLNINIPGVNVKSYMNNKMILQMIINIHMVPGTWTTSKITNGQKLQSKLAGASGALTVVKQGSDVFIKSAGSQPKIVQANIMAGNSGVLQVLDGMLLPINIKNLGH